MFKTVTVDTITKSLTKMINDLNALASKHDSEIAVNNIAINALAADNAVRTAEITRANKVSKKLESLLAE